MIQAVLKTRNRILRGRRYLLFSGLLLGACFLTPPALPAQVNPAPISPDYGAPAYGDTPSWLLMAQGKQAYYRQDFGSALVLFREVVRKEGLYPDSEMWIGFVHEAEGSYELALRHYERALEMGEDFTVPEEKYLLYYRKAAIYRRLDNRGLMEREYEALIAEAETPLPGRMEMLRTVKNRGLDKAIELYRPKNRITMQARLELGEFYLDSGRTEAALPHLFFSVMTPITTAIEALLEADPEYEFIRHAVPARGAVDSFTENFALFMEDVHRSSRLSDYFKEVDFYRGLYAFARALTVDPAGRRSAEELFLLLAEWPQAGSFRIRARGEL